MLNPTKPLLQFGKTLIMTILFLLISSCFVFAQSGWFPLNSGSSASLLSTFFTDPSTGYAVGVGGVIRKTTNAGANWFSQTASTTYWLRSVFFTSTDTGYIASGNVNAPYDGKIFKTTNGGDNWTLLALPVNDYFYSIDFVTPGTGYVSGFPDNT
jgi:photosystem II stability/assembly factor-like uncharacterized protein